MQLETNYINRRLIEVNCDELSSGVLNKKEAEDLAKELIIIVAELLDVEE